MTRTRNEPKASLRVNAGAFFLATVLVLTTNTPAVAKEPSELPAGPIKATLFEGKGGGDLYEAKYGRRSMWVETRPTEDFEMRLALWPLVGEPVEHYEFRMPRLDSLTFRADAGYANIIEISSVGDGQGPNYISHYGDGVVIVLVSQDVLDKIEYVDFSFSIETHRLDELPDEFYSGYGYVDDRRRDISHSNHVYIHSRNPGVLARPGKWGWDVPGSPAWGNFLSPFGIPLGEDEYGLPEDRRMEKDTAREAFRRMLWHFHALKEELFVNNSFDIQNLRVNASRILNFIYEHRPETYAKIMEREHVAGKDAHMTSLMSGLTRAYADARDDQGIIRTSADLARRIASIDQAFAAFEADIGDDVKHEWRDLRQQYTDAPFERALSELGVELGSLTEKTYSGMRDGLRRTVTSLISQAQGKASARLLDRMRDVERLVSITPPQRTPPQSGKELYSDEHRVRVVYHVVDTGKHTSCTSSPEQDLNSTDKKIKIWKVTLQITNGSKRKIKPHGALIAHIDVEPDQGSSLNYCSYTHVGHLYKNDGQSEQKKSMFGIASGVYFIGAEKTFSNSTYLYLYEDQNPLLTNWNFGGYEFLEDKAKAKQNESKDSQQPTTQATPDKQPASSNVDTPESSGPSGSLILLIDVSGSMDGAKLSSAKQAAIETIRKSVKSKTEIAVLAFEGDCASPINSSIGFTRDETQLVDFVDGLVAQGGTPLATALEATNRFMNEHKSAAGTAQMILLLADGDDSCGGLETVLQELKQENLLYRHETVGLEVSGDAQQQLQNIARQSGGNYHSATSQNLSKVFSDAVDLMKMLDMLGKFR